jgi:hypothetical protein
MKKYSKDGKVVFDSEYHTYFLGEKQLLSVTRFIERFKNIFDSEGMASKYALKHGLEKEEVLEMWRVKGEEACNVGHAVHSVFENFIKTGQIYLPGVHQKELVAKSFIEKIFIPKRLEPIEAEVVVHNEILASQIDCVAKNPKGEYFIFDWKTVFMQ